MFKKDVRDTFRQDSDGGTWVLLWKFLAKVHFVGMGIFAKVCKFLKVYTQI